MDILVDGCRIAFMEELDFWDIDEMVLETCCHQVDGMVDIYKKNMTTMTTSTLSLEDIRTILI